MEKKNLLAWVMKSANELKKEFGLSMKIALKTAWTLIMNRNVIFAKDDGEIREAKLMNGYVSKTKEGNVVVKFIELADGIFQYRSFRVDRLVSSKGL